MSLFIAILILSFNVFVLLRIWRISKVYGLYEAYLLDLMNDIKDEDEDEKISINNKHFSL